LKSLYGREIDLLEEQALKNPILIQSINRSKQLVYGLANFEVVIRYQICY
jgi:hypothetical protein